MALLLVNQVPSAGQPVKPGGPYLLGLRSTTGVITPAELQVLVGSSNIEHHGILPELDTLLPSVALHSPDLRQPEGSPVTVTNPTGLIRFAHAGVAFSKSVYEIEVPVEPGTSTMAYLRIRKGASWGLVDNPAWCNRLSMGPLFFGLANGEFNTGAFMFLQGGTTPAVVCAGTQSSPNVVRQFEQAYEFNWVAAPVGENFDLYVYFNFDGYDQPITPDHQPTAEFWIGSDTIALTRLAIIPIGELGTFANRSTKSSVTLMFGNGSPGTTLDVVNWHVIPNFTLAIDEGNARANHRIAVTPVAPVSYLASSKTLPNEIFGNRWLLDTSGSPVFDPSFTYQPGRKRVSQALRLEKSGTGSVAYRRDEPLLGLTAREGFTLEAFMAAEVTTYQDASFCAGIEADDGVSVFRVGIVSNGSTPAFALSRTNGTTAASHTILGSVDASSLKLVRLVADRTHDKLQVYIDDELLLSETLSTATLPATSGTARMRFGHLVSGTTAGHLDVAFTNIYPLSMNYDARVATLIPSLDPVAFTALGSASSATVSGGVLSIPKTVFGVTSSKGSFLKTDYPFSEYQGSFVEARCRVKKYTNSSGEPFAPSSQTGAGIVLHIGYKKLFLNFFAAGLAGRMVGLVSASADADAQVAQTAEARSLSVPVDWTEFHTYRIHYRPFERIDIWVDELTAAPAISLPWENGFALPTYGSSAFGIEFGHHSEDESGVTEWEYIRFGSAGSWDINIQQDLPTSLLTSKFDGTARFFLFATDDISGTLGLPGALPMPLVDGGGGGGPMVYTIERTDIGSNMNIIPPYSSVDCHVNVTLNSFVAYGSPVTWTALSGGAFVTLTPFDINDTGDQWGVAITAPDDSHLGSNVVLRASVDADPAVFVDMTLTIQNL